MGGLRGTDIVNITDVSRARVSRWKSETVRPQPNTQLVLSDLLDVVGLLGDYYTAGEIRPWLFALHPQLDNERAIDLVNFGRASSRRGYSGKVWRVVGDGRDPLQCSAVGGRRDDRTFDVVYTSTEADGAVAEPVSALRARRRGRDLRRDQVPGRAGGPGPRHLGLRQAVIRRSRTGISADAGDRRGRSFPRELRTPSAQRPIRALQPRAVLQECRTRGARDRPGSWADLVGRLEETGVRATRWSQLSAGWRAGPVPDAFVRRSAMKRAIQALMP